MRTTTKRAKIKGRCKRGATLLEFAAALTLFFICLFVPLIDISFIPVRYLLTFNNLDSVATRMALFEKRSQALQYLHNDKSWKNQVEGWGVTVKNVSANLVVCEQPSGSKVMLAEGAQVPSRLLPGGSKNGCTYALEITTTVDVPPLYNSKVGLPGFSQPIEFKFHNRAQWENLSPDPYTTTDSKAVQFYINE